VSERPRVPDAIDAGFSPRLREGVAFVPIGDRAVLYVEADGLLHRLDAIGATVCELLEGSASIAAIAGELAAAFDRDRSVVERDVVSFVRALAAIGLIDGVAPAEVTTEP
jgi:hypothetical protein